MRHPKVGDIWSYAEAEFKMYYLIMDLENNGDSKYHPYLATILDLNSGKSIVYDWPARSVYWSYVA